MAVNHAVGIETGGRSFQFAAALLSGVFIDQTVVHLAEG